MSQTHFLSVVFRNPGPDRLAELCEADDAIILSHSHMRDERDALKERCCALEEELRQARESMAALATQGEGAVLPAIDPVAIQQAAAAVVDRVLWTSNASDVNKRILTEAIRDEVVALYGGEATAEERAAWIERNVIGKPGEIQAMRIYADCDHVPATAPVVEMEALPRSARNGEGMDFVSAVRDAILTVEGAPPILRIDSFADISGSKALAGGKTKGGKGRRK